MRRLSYLSLKHDLVQVAEEYTLEVESQSQTERVGEPDLNYVNLTKSESRD